MSRQQIDIPPDFEVVGQAPTQVATTLPNVPQVAVPPGFEVVGQAPQIPLEALPLGLQQTFIQTGEAAPTEEILGRVVESVGSQKADIVGGVAGGLLGARFGIVTGKPKGSASNGI